MLKNNFLSILKTAIQHRVKKKTSLCRCADCYNERRKNQGKTVSGQVK